MNGTPFEGKAFFCLSFFLVMCGTLSESLMFVYGILRVFTCCVQQRKGLHQQSQGRLDRFRVLVCSGSRVGGVGLTLRVQVRNN